MILNKTYGFTGEKALVAPQANAMAAVIEPLMSDGGAPWLLYAFGALIALVLNFLKVPALAFALGMFIPFELNIPLLIGGGINWLISTRTKDKKLNQVRQEKGTLLASGFIAGGALMGVVSAALRFGGLDFINNKWAESAAAEWLALIMYAMLIGYFIWDVMRISPKDKQKN